MSSGLWSEERKKVVKVNLSSLKQYKNKGHNWLNFKSGKINSETFFFLCSILFSKSSPKKPGLLRKTNLSKIELNPGDATHVRSNVRGALRVFGPVVRITKKGLELLRYNGTDL